MNTTWHQREEGLDAVEKYVSALASDVAQMELKAAKMIAVRRGELVSLPLSRLAQRIQNQERHYRA
jgi:hypothetical protein